MTDDRQEELQRLFDMVTSLPAAERGAVLARECGGDAKLEARVEAMVAASEDEWTVRDGYSDPFRIAHERELDPLHETARFRGLVARLESAQGRGGGAP